MPASLRAARDLDQVIAELSFHRPLHFAHGSAEHDRIEFVHHLAGPEFAELAAAA